MTTPSSVIQPPSQADVAALLLSIVAKKAGLDVEMIDLDMNLAEDLGLDSITRIEIVAAMRDALPLVPNVTEEELSKIRTLRDVVRFF